MVQAALLKLQNPKTVGTLCKLCKGASPAHYLARVMVNKARKQHRHARLTYRALRRLGRADVTDSNRSPQWIVEQDELRTKVREVACRVLSVEDHEMLWWFYEDGLSTEEIAKKRKCSVDAVCKRLSRARQDSCGNH